MCIYFTDRTSSFSYSHFIVWRVSTLTDHQVDVDLLQSFLPVTYSHSTAKFVRRLIISTGIDHQGEGECDVTSMVRVSGA